MNYTTIKGSFLVFLSAVFFGIAPVLLKFAYQTEITPITLSACCYIIATAIFTLYFILFKQPFRIPHAVLVRVLLLGVFLRGGMNMCFFIGYQYISASLGELIFYLYPAMTLIIAHIYLKENFTMQKGLAVIISFGGCFLILHQPSSGASLLGVVLMLAAAIINALYMNFSSVLLKNHFLSAVSILFRYRMLFYAYPCRTVFPYLNLGSFPW